MPKEIEYKGSGIGTDRDGVRFNMDFAALPTDLNKLQIELVSFGADHKVHKEIKLEKDKEERSIDIKEKNIKINKVYEIENETYITITSEESVLLSKVYLIVDGSKVELQETVNDEYDKREDGTTAHTRTLRFKASGDELKLDIERLKYNKLYNKRIDIPVN